MLVQMAEQQPTQQILTASPQVGAPHMSVDHRPQMNYKRPRVLSKLIFLVLDKLSINFVHSTSVNNT